MLYIVSRSDIWLHLAHLHVSLIVGPIHEVVQGVREGQRGPPSRHALVELGVVDKACRHNRGPGFIQRVRRWLCVDRAKGAEGVDALQAQ